MVACACAHQSLLTQSPHTLTLPSTSLLTASAQVYYAKSCYSPISDMTQGMLKYTYNIAAGTNTLQLYTSGKPLHTVMVSASKLHHHCASRLMFHRLMRTTHPYCSFSCLTSLHIVCSCSCHRFQQSVG